MRLRIEKFPDGSLCLECEDQELDMVFTTGAMVPQDPLYTKQRQHLENIVEMFNTTCGDIDDSKKAED